MENLLKKLINDIQVFQKFKDKKDYVDSYNVFSVLNITNREIYHSRFLADLLNPKGLHKKGTIFLEAFLNELNQVSDEKFENSDLENTNVITEEVTNYGNLDISLKNKHFYIIIENKVWAGDQDAQLHRYSNTVFNGKNPQLVYLSPNGVSPSKNSLGNLNEKKILKISYKGTIVEWINNCLKNEKILNNKNISNILNQYIETIKFEKDDMMEIEIKNEEIKDYLLLQESLNLALVKKRNDVLKLFFTKLNESLNNENNLHSNQNNLRSIYIYFTYKEFNYGIGLDSVGLYIGYYKAGKDYSKDELKKLVEDNKNFHDKNLRYVYLDNNFTSTNDYFIIFVDSKELQDYIQKIISKIKTIIN
jgi:hypothetical protein